MAIRHVTVVIEHAPFLGSHATSPKCFPPEALQADQTPPESAAWLNAKTVHAMTCTIIDCLNIRMMSVLPSTLVFGCTWPTAGVERTISVSKQHGLSFQNKTSCCPVWLTISYDKRPSMTCSTLSLLTSMQLSALSFSLPAYCQSPPVIPSLPKLSSLRHPLIKALVANAVGPNANSR
jgi:hypothetical protein